MGIVAKCQGNVRTFAICHGILGLLLTVREMSVNIQNTLKVPDLGSHMSGKSQGNLNFFKIMELLGNLETVKEIWNSW